MKIGMVGLGKMGLNMTKRLQRAGHTVVAFDLGRAKVEEARASGATPAFTYDELVRALEPPRAVWAMVPAGNPVEQVIAEMQQRFSPGDLFVDGGNSNYKDSKRHYERLKSAKLMFVDAGVSGGIWGLENGYCMMLGGDKEAIARLKPALDALAPKEGWLHAGPAGAGHFVKMIHNGIEYGMMQSYAEGFEVLQAGDYTFDLAAIAHLWNQGSVVRSWLLELAERAFEKDPGLEQIRGWVEDSGEGRWTVMEAIDRSVPAEVLALALMSRFRSRQPDSFRDKVIAALRGEFGGHAVKTRG
jgi:6-phosphogluconate dehydrogenase